MGGIDETHSPSLHQPPQIQTIMESERGESTVNSTKIYHPYKYVDEQGRERNLSLPFPKQITLPPAHPFIQLSPNNPNILTEACGTKVISGAIIGTILGAAMGTFFGAMGDPSPIQVIHGKEVPEAPLREQVRGAFRNISARPYQMGKQFMVLTALFGGVECVIEKYRAKHDVWNPVLSGCAVGATLGASGGPTAACLGCVGFGGFSLVVDKIMGH